MPHQIGLLFYWIWNKKNNLFKFLEREKGGAGADVEKVVLNWLLFLVEKIFLVLGQNQIDQITACGSNPKSSSFCISLGAKNTHLSLNYQGPPFLLFLHGISLLFLSMCLCPSFSSPSEEQLGCLFLCTLLYSNLPSHSLMAAPPLSNMPLNCSNTTSILSDLRRSTLVT